MFCFFCILIGVHCVYCVRACVRAVRCSIACDIVCVCVPASKNAMLWWWWCCGLAGWLAGTVVVLFDARGLAWHACRYSGDWKSGVRDGQGSEERPDGTKYNGFWKDGALYCCYCCCCVCCVCCVCWRRFLVVLLQRCGADIIAVAVVVVIVVLLLSLLLSSSSS